MQSISEMPFVAGHAALDFVNTAEERGHPEADDALRTPADLGLWGRRYGLLSSHADDGEQARGELRRALDARELLYWMFFDRMHDRPASREQLEHLAALASTAYRAASLESSADGRLRWSWSRSQLASVRHVAVTAGLELLRSEPSGRLKQCAGDHCGWFFLDATKRGNRRWCSMSECGQEAKSARRRARSRPKRSAQRNHPG